MLTEVRKCFLMTGYLKTKYLDFLERQNSKVKTQIQNIFFFL